MLGSEALGLGVAVLAVAAGLWYQLQWRRRRRPVDPNDGVTVDVSGSDSELATFDFVVVGGGVSGCYLATLLAERHETSLVCLINEAGPPLALWRTYMLNLVGVALPSLVPHFAYRLRSHKRQFANCCTLGGNSNINAAVGPVPTEADIRHCLGDAFVPAFRAFCADDGDMHRVSRPAQPAPGLDRLSRDLERRGVPGGRVRVFSDGFRRIHPYADILMRSPARARVTVRLAHAERIVFNTDAEARASSSCEKFEGGPEEASSPGKVPNAAEAAGAAEAEAEEVPRATGVECADGAVVSARRGVFLCCGALESPKLLLRSGVGPRDVVEPLLGAASVVLRADGVGRHLSDHWVGRAKADAVPSHYGFPFWYPHILGYKHASRGVAVGFGKLQLLGRNTFSFATTTCAAPGRILLAADGRLEPCLPLGAADAQAFHAGLRHLVRVLADLGVAVRPAVGPLAPNWHYSCTLGVGRVVDEALRVKGLGGVHVADVSALREICPMNTQMLAYFVPFALMYNSVNVE